LILIFFGTPKSLELRRSRDSSGSDGECSESGSDSGGLSSRGRDRWTAFLCRDLAIHGGWNDYRSKEEDHIIGEYQLAYALCLDDQFKAAGIVFTKADKMFGALRHAKYLLTLNDR
jgi:hypothetical protein